MIRQDCNTRLVKQNEAKEILCQTCSVILSDGGHQLVHLLPTSPLGNKKLGVLLALHEEPLCVGEVGGEDGPGGPN